MCLQNNAHCFWRVSCADVTPNGSLHQRRDSVGVLTTVSLLNSFSSGFKYVSDGSGFVNLRLLIEFDIDLQAWVWVPVYCQKTSSVVKSLHMRMSYFSDSVLLGFLASTISAACLLRSISGKNSASASHRSSSSSFYKFAVTRDMASEIQDVHLLSTQHML